MVLTLWQIPFRIFLLTAVATACADTVVLSGKPPFRHVRVTKLDSEGRLVFIGVSRQTLRKPLEQVAWLSIDSFASLSAAEDAARAGNLDDAVRRYRDAIDRAPERWRRDLAKSRLLRVLSDAGRVGPAVALHLELRKAIEPYALRTLPEPGSASSREAIETVSELLRRTESSRVRTNLESVLVQLLIHEGADTIPASLTLPEEVLPGRVHLSVPEESSTAPTYGLIPKAVQITDLPRIPADSVLLRSAENAFGDRSDPARALRILEDAKPFVEPDAWPHWRIMMGRAHIAGNTPAAAAADLLELAENHRDPAISRTSLYYVGLAHEGIERPGVARDMYVELLKDESTPDDVRGLAREGLKRVGGDNRYPAD